MIVTEVARPVTGSGVVGVGGGPPGCPQSGCKVTPGVVLVLLIVLAVCVLIGYLTGRR